MAWWLIFTSHFAVKAQRNDCYILALETDFYPSQFLVHIGHWGGTTCLRLTCTLWRVPLSLLTGTSLRVPGTGAGVQILGDKVGGYLLQVPTKYLPEKKACLPSWAGLAHWAGNDRLGELAMTCLVSNSFPDHWAGCGLLTKQVVACSPSRL